MNNQIIQVMNMMRNGGNPKQMLTNMMRQNAGNNPVAQNALQMMEKGDMKGIEGLCRNIAKERNIDLDSMVNQMKGQFGIK